MLRRDRATGKGKRSWKRTRPLRWAGPVSTCLHLLTGLQAYLGQNDMRESVGEKEESSTDICYFCIQASLPPVSPSYTPSSTAPFTTFNQSNKPCQNTLWAYDCRYSMANIFFSFRKTILFFRPHECSGADLTDELWMSQVIVVCNLHWITLNRALCFCCEFCKDDQYSPRAPRVTT